MPDTDIILKNWILQVKKGFSKPIILLTLANNPNYPYRLTKDISDKSNNQIVIAGSNIYPILKDLTDEGLVVKEKIVKPTKGTDSSKKQYRSVYSVTDSGMKLLDDFKPQLGDFLNIIDSFIEK
ncbi:MAG: PadR family transcriptional regulator [Candidatus Hodarchaeales archaeon]